MNTFHKRSIIISYHIIRCTHYDYFIRATLPYIKFSFFVFRQHNILQ